MESKTDRDVTPEVDQSIAPNVHSLKMFFQNQKQSIIGVKHMLDNQLETTSSTSSLSLNDPKAIASESSTVTKSYNRNNRVIPRPPKAIESLDINVRSLSKPLTSSQSDRPVPPVPKPRKSLLKNQSIDNLLAIKAIEGSSDTNMRSNSLMASLTKELNEMNLKDNKLRAQSLHCLKTNESNSIINEELDTKHDELKAETTSEAIGCVVQKSDTNATKSSTKSRKAFKTFLKRSKLLSLRKRSAQKSDTKCQTNSPSSVSQMRPIKPTRSPPVPPVLQFRPPAPLPVSQSRDDYYEDTLNETIRPVNTTLNEELYNDSVDNSEDFEQIYSTLDNEDQSDADIYEGVDHMDDHYDDGLTGDKDLYSTDNYYDSNGDSDGIYEVLPFEKDMQTDCSSSSTIDLDEYLNDQLNKQAISVETPPPVPHMDRSERKRNLKAIKLRKKYNLTGNEIPVNAGTVKEDYKGNRLDLFVRKGETVLILRMEGNPPGKWLAKNERSSIGFVHLDNISFDAESVKCIIKTLTAPQTT